MYYFNTLRLPYVTSLSFHARTREIGLTAGRVTERFGSWQRWNWTSPDSSLYKILEEGPEAVTVILEKLFPRSISISLLAPYRLYPIHV